MSSEVPTIITIESCPEPTIENLKADLDRVVIYMNRMIWERQDVEREFRDYRKSAMQQRQIMVDKANAYKEELVQRGDFHGAAAVMNVVKEVIDRRQAPPPIPVDPAE